MKQIVFSQSARRDRREITAFTVERFGVAQARKLRVKMESTLNMLAEIPSAGRQRPELDPPGRTFRYFVVGKTFIVVYEPTDDGIRVARILHGSRQLVDEIERDAGD